MKKSYLVLIALLAGCSAQVESSRAEPAASPAAPAVETTQRVEAPLAVTLTGAADKVGQVQLTARVQVKGRLAVAPTMTLKLPEGAKLVSGQLTETLAQEKGTYERTFVVSGVTDGVVVEVKATGQHAGAVATARYPEQEAPKAAEIKTVPIRPTQIGGATVDRAIPLAPGKPSP